MNKNLWKIREYTITKVLGLLEKSKLLLIAGRPESGKTVFATQLAGRFGNDGRHEILFFSLQHEKEELEKCYGFSEQEGITIDDFPRLSIKDIYQKVYVYEQRNSLYAVIIDEVLLVSGMECKNTRKEEIADVCAALYGNSITIL